MQLELEVYDLVEEEYVYIGKGGGSLLSLVPTKDSNIFFILDLAAYEPRLQGPRPCEILMRGCITDIDPLEGEAGRRIDRHSDKQFRYGDSTQVK